MRSADAERGNTDEAAHVAGHDHAALDPQNVLRDPLRAS